jgi:hypothetical protein
MQKRSFEMERFIQNKTFDEIRPGDRASMQRNLAATELRAGSVLLGDGSAGADGSKEGSLHTQALAVPKKVFC